MNDNINLNKPSLNITPEDLHTLQCETCKHEVFAEGIIIKTVSALLTGTGKEGMLPVPVFYCINCKSIVEKYLPDNMKKTKLIKK